MTTFTEQSHLDMPPPGWLHVNGVSLSTDIHQQTSDYQTKNITSSNPPLVSPTNSIPFTIPMKDGQQNNKQYQKLDNADSLKKLFIDRQIKKATSLPGLIKGTALSHHSALYTNPIPSNQSTNNSHDDSFLPNVNDNDDDLSPIHQHHEQTNEIRRPRVSFSDCNKVQFFEDNNDISPQTPRRRHRYRSSKKSIPIINNNQVSPPSIQQSQSLYNPYHSLSRQQPVGHELNIKKQQLNPSPRTHSSRITHLPDLLNQSLPIESSMHEKYILQREKTLYRLPETTIEIPINSSTEISRESTRAGGLHPSPVQNSNEQNSKLDINDGGINSLLNSSSISSSLTSRQRPHLRRISLRRQFTSHIKSKSINIPNNYQTITNSRRSASLKHSITHIHSSNDDDHEEINNNGLISPYDYRPMTGVNSSKQSKRNYIIHFNSKNPFNGNTTIDSSETDRHLIKSSQESFRNVLKIVQPPYVTGINDSNLVSTLQTNTNGSIRSSHTNSAHESHEYLPTSNTIFV